MRRDVAAVDYDAVSHEAVSFLGGEQVNPLPDFVQSRESLGGIRAGKDQCSFIVERAQAGVEMVAIRIDELQGHDGDSHFGHRGGEFLHTA